jgi:hypothetical protein
MPNVTNVNDVNEMYFALDELLGLFLRVSPRHSDLPVVRRADDLLRRMSPVKNGGSRPGGDLRHWAQLSGPDSLITGSD